MVHEAAGEVDRREAHEAAGLLRPIPSPPSSSSTAAPSPSPASPLRHARDEAGEAD